MKSSNVLAITSGNFNGIGPEIILKSLYWVFHKKLLRSITNDTLSIITNLKKKIFSYDFLELLVIGSLPSFKWHAKKMQLEFSIEEEKNIPIQKIFPNFFLYRISSLGKIGGKKEKIPPVIKVTLLDIPIPIKDYGFKSFNNLMNYAVIKTFLKSYSKSLNSISQIKGKREIAWKLVGENAAQILNASEKLIKKKWINGVVNAPISKESIITYSSIRNFVGQTEFYAQIFKTKKFSMTFFSPLFNLILLTTHIPLSQVAYKITPQSVRRAIDHAIEIKHLIGDKKKILFLGLNPHAGENGKIGQEDKHIRSVIDKHRYRKMIVGPLPADTAFLKVFAGEHKVVVSGYHDQGLIPLKSIGDNIYHSVNVTWGLPFVRVSVNHGTAFEMVGKNSAQPFSFMSALSLALLMTSGNRKKHS